MKDQAYQIKALHLHEVDLGPNLPEETLLAIVAQRGGDEVVKAVLQLLRRRAADDRAAAANASINSHSVHTDPTGVVTLVPANNPVFHLGAAQGAEDAFWSLYRAILPPESTEQE